MSIAQDLRFHIQEIDTPDAAMKKLNTVFGIQNVIMAHQLENELLTFNPNNFSSIEDFLLTFKTLRLILEGCKVKKEDGSFIYSIIARLGLAYSVFFFTFHSTREALITQGIAYKSPSFDPFCNSLIREQEKILHLGLFNTGNSSKKALSAQQQPYERNPKK